jgi:hypothetical protein
MKDYLLKSTSIITAFLMLFVQTQVFASPVNVNVDLPSLDVAVFQLDDASLNVAMQELNELESYLDLNVGVTYSDVAQNASDLLLNVSPSVAPAGGSEAPLGIPSFLWGCVLGWVGILIVYLVSDEDMDETKKALWGCLTGTAVGVVVYFVAFAAAATTSTY